MLFLVSIFSYKVVVVLWKSDGIKNSMIPLSLLTPTSMP